MQSFLILHSDVRATEKTFRPTFSFRKTLPWDQYIVIEKSTGSVYDNERFIQLIPITRTLANSNPRLTRTKTDFPWIPSYIYCNFTLDNSNLPLTRSNFCFPSDHFYIILLSITRTMFFLESEKKTVYWRPKHWILNFPLTCCGRKVYCGGWCCHKSNVKQLYFSKSR